jgi:hypothetical protein
MLVNIFMQVSEDAADTSASQRLREQVVKLKVANGMLQSELEVGLCSFLLQLAATASANVPALNVSHAWVMLEERSPGLQCLHCMQG